MEFRPFRLMRQFTSHLVGGPTWQGGPRDIVATLYDDGVILETSPSAGDVIGAAGNLAGRSIYDFVDRGNRAALRALFARAAERCSFAKHVDFKEKFWLLRVRRARAQAEIMLRPLPRGRMAALIRLTNWKEEADAQAASAPDEAAERAATVDYRPAQQSESMDTELLANLAHELKTPLNAIMGFADAMRAETYGPLGRDDLGERKYAEYINDIHASGEHLKALIEAAQDYSRAQAGRYSIEPAPTDVGALVEECATMVRDAAAKAGLALNVEIEPDLPQTMLDARAIKQILINLLSNAVKFTDIGEVTISVAAEKGALVFTVRDTGVGMNNVVLAKLGGRYSDTHRTGVRGAGGSGLGLSLCFELARLHGGALTFDSEPGVGTTARLVAPMGGKAADPTYRAPGGIQSQLDRVNAYRAERARTANAA